MAALPHRRFYMRNIMSKDHPDDPKAPLRAKYAETLRDIRRSLSARPLPLNSNLENLKLQARRQRAELDRPDVEPAARRHKVDAVEFDFDRAIPCSQQDLHTYFGGKGKARGGTVQSLKESRLIIDFRKLKSTYWVIMPPKEVERFRQHVQERKLRDQRGKTRKNATKRGRTRKNAE
jgi:hypothetical protein